ncbi:MAG: beta-eliminating lyase-related protein, partial [Candidatus Krumholzibacteriota bacterium]
YGVRPIRENDLKKIKTKVHLFGDGLGLSPQEYAHLLDDLADDDGIAPDRYSRGGVVEELEQKFAQMLGKEAAVFMPTGTLANHLAVRLLCGERRKVIVPAESHIYNDAGDCAQTLSGLNLVPLAPGEATFTLAEVTEAVRRARAGRVKAEVGAIMLESPVRRRNNAVFRWDEMQRVAAFARDEGIGLHLDGARLPVAAVHSGRAMSEYAALFDTVYVSLYKCYNAASGAILAGPSKLLEGLYHDRRRFGGGMPYVWPFAAVALHYADGFAEEYAAALKVADEVFSRLADSGKFAVERVLDGTNVVLLRLVEGDPEELRERLIGQNVVLPVPADDGVFAVKVNPTWNRVGGENLVGAILEAV